MHHTTANGTKFFLVFRPKDKYDYRLANSLYVEFSLPKLIYGCNHRMIDDWNYALDEANAELARIPGLPPLMDIRDAPLYRLDICFNFQVGENGMDYIQALQKAYYPRRSSKSYKNEGNKGTGVLFKPDRGGISLSFYLKSLECGHIEAEGILRAEISIRKKPIITKLFGERGFALRTLRVEAAMALLRKELRTLKLDRDIVGDRFEVEHRLSEVYSPRQVRTLMGYLFQKQTKTYDQMIKGGTSRQSIYYYEKLLKKVDLTCFSLEERRVLPALLPLLSSGEQNFLQSAK